MKKMLLLVMLLLGVSATYAQQVYNSSGKTNYKKKKKGGYDPDKLVLGGGINFGLATHYFSIGTSPFIGYHVLKPLSVGVGLGYLYQRQAGTIDQNNKIYFDKANLIYPNVWVRCNVYHQYYVLAGYEYDLISVNQAVPDLVTGEIKYRRASVTNQCALIGAGVRNSLGGRASLYFELVYDLLQGQYSPYPAGIPGTRLGIAFGM